MSEVVLHTGELVDYDPVTPIELEYLIQEIGKRLEAAVPAIKSMWADRYTAERNLIEARAKAVLTSTAGSITEKRAEADLASLPYRLEFDLKKETLHAAEELQKALSSRLIGLQNINKVLGQSYGATR